MADDTIPEDALAVVTQTSDLSHTSPGAVRFAGPQKPSSRSVSRGRSGPQSRPGSRPASRPASRPVSVFSQDYSNGDRHEVMVKYLYAKCNHANWLESFEAIPPQDGSASLAVFIRRPDGSYVSEPAFASDDLVKAVGNLAPAVALTMSSPITSAFLEQIPPLHTEIAFGAGGAVLPIVDSIADIAYDPSLVSNQAFLCLVRQEQYLLVWSKSVPSILAHAHDVETRIMGLIWGTPIANPTPVWTPTHTARASISIPRAANSYFPPASSPAATPHGMVAPYPSDSSATNSLGKPAFSEKYSSVIQSAIDQEELGDRAFDPEKESQEAPTRPFLLTHATTIGLAMALVVLVEMACVAKLLQESRLDDGYLRWALLVTVPVFGSFSLFFMVVITGSLFQLFGPLSNVSKNSVYFSAKAPKPERHWDYELPHVTIQVPVFKEGLKGVIIPTVTSLLAAVKNYEARGGTASIYMNEDGMQLVSPQLAEARKAYYEMNNIGWCSRPPHYTGKTAAKKGGWFSRNKKQDASTPAEEITEEKSRPIFIRKGKFKKASNMNYCLDFSIRVEDELQRLIDAKCTEKGCTQEQLTVDEEEELYEKARDTIVENDEGRTWAAGDVRIGEIILIVDSDTRVPEDCLLYAALEMHESPEVALLQHTSGILNVVNNVFENGITYFTNLIYTSIQFAVGNGDVAPFVGHNTFIRWKALQSISYQEDSRTKFWSESHVSEDFDVSLRFQMNHFIVRMATYHNGGFKEGVSLTVYDELARWEKYAYGVNELMFHPFVKWPTKGPFTPLFRKFIFSNIKVTSKVTIYAYIFTYYAIASAIPLTLANYLIVGWFSNNIDHFYITSWKIFVGMAVVFNILSPLAYAMLRHRLGQKTFFWSVVETIKWTPMFLLFFGGISYHLFKAILCHFFSINMEWTTTAKELEKSGFRMGLDRVFKDFKWMYLFIFPLLGGMIYLALYAPWGWTITDFAAIVPLANQLGCHALLPFALGLF